MKVLETFILFLAVLFVAFVGVQLDNWLEKKQCFGQTCLEFIK